MREAESLDGLVLLLSGLEQTELLERIGISLSYFFVGKITYHL